MERNGMPGVEKQLVTELAALVLERTVPEELQILAETAEEYFADPQAVVRPKRRDEPLGFGVDIALAAPYVLAAVTPVVHYLASVVADGVKDAAADVVAERVRRLFRRAGARPAAGESLALGPEQVHCVRDAAYRHAVALGMPGDQAASLADAVVGSLLSRN
ncbi:MAG TPA: hypothetical protein VJT49_15110 [Amycolatopsis sp.]|uniref:hypothetical protein n=1 Tax=Amycolatopsis sp. TaxID=37632 RepID=UPI002B49ECF9|nr:hypothetical protein [Amycolatopsis sp.]HKS46409.1 hypothetical protein [Amycolatopsis sp.]